MARGQPGSTVFLTKICPICGNEFKTPDTISRRNKKWCSKKCCESSPEKKAASGKSLRENNKLKRKSPTFLNSLFDIKYGKTIRRILRDLDAGCSRCGWKEACCDLHHIYGKKIPNSNDHSNLTYICPNCHRLFHSKKIGPDDVKSLQESFGDSWKQLYYG